MIQEMASGLSAEELFERGIGLSYSDFTTLNTQFANIDRGDISLETELGKGIKLQTPIIASPMDTVTNDKLCIALALQGGIGAIHYNHKGGDGKPSIDMQVKEIVRVKRFQNGFIENPVTISPDMTIVQAIEVGEKNRIGDWVIRTFPVTADGKNNGRLVGLLRKYDYFRGSRTDLKVRDRMILLENLVVAEYPVTLDRAKEILWENHISSLPIVDGVCNLKYLVTRRDIEKSEQYPLATKDANNRLRVIFAVDTRPEAHERLELGFAAGADGVIVDASQGFTKYARDTIRYIKNKFPDKLLIGGNISTREAAKFLAEEGIDAYRNGQGSGSTCTTAGAIGIARAPATAVYECSRSLVDTKVSTIADGGLREVGDIFKAIAIGAHCAMLGNLLAGTEESPGEVIIDRETGLPTKVYRGMGSAEANVGSCRGYTRLPEGILARVKYRGSIHMWVPLIRDGLIHALEVQDCRNIAELHRKMYAGELRFDKENQQSHDEIKRSNLFL